MVTHLRVLALHQQSVALLPLLLHIMDAQAVVTANLVLCTEIPTLIGVRPIAPLIVHMAYQLSSLELT
jgi:hypothetical protein